MKGLKHFLPNGKEYNGETHKADGKLMTGKVHTADSVFLTHELVEKKPMKGRMVKGSQAAKDYMQSLRNKRK